MKCEAMREKPINKGLQQFHRSVARIWELLRRVHFELLIIGSQVRALVRPPTKASDFRYLRRMPIAVLRDNLDETGATIWMRRGGRAER